MEVFLLLYQLILSPVLWDPICLKDFHPAILSCLSPFSLSHSHKYTDIFSYLLPLQILPI